MELQHSRSSGLIKAIFVTGLLAGTLDMTTAILYYRIPPLPMFRYIASAAFGKEAVAGNIPLAMTGLLFHYIIAFSWTILFFVLYPKTGLLRKNKYVVAVVYGIVVWVVMNLIVVPMTHIAKQPFRWSGAVQGAVILILMIGLPVSILANRYYSGRSRNP